VESGAPFFGNALARLAPAGGVVELRSQGMFQGRNFQEAAHIAARQFFAALPGARASSGELTPQARTSGGWWRGFVLRRDVRQLWRLAANKAPERCSASQFARLLVLLDDLRKAIAAGDLHLDFEATNSMASGRA
jgi:hypothetical protein